MLFQVAMSALGLKRVIYLHKSSCHFCSACGVAGSIDMEL